MIRTACILACCAVGLAAVEIDPVKLVPGGVITIEAPELGHSSQIHHDSQKQEPVRFHLSLPKNWQRDRAHPVVFFLGRDHGTMDKLGELRTALDDMNYIVMGVDYTAPAEGDVGLRNTSAALEALAKVTAIDPDGLILLGEGHGARTIAQSSGSKPAARFRAFVLIIHGTGGMDARRLQDKTVLIMGGSGDHDQHTDARGVIVGQRRVYDQLATGGVDVTMIEHGGGHWWGSEYTSSLKTWFRHEAPVAERIRFEHLVHVLEHSRTARRKAWAEAELAATWWRDVTREKRLAAAEKARQEAEKKRLEAEKKQAEAERKKAEAEQIKAEAEAKKQAEAEAAKAKPPKPAP